MLVGVEFSWTENQPNRLAYLPTFSYLHISVRFGITDGSDSFVLLFKFSDSFVLLFLQK